MYDPAVDLSSIKVNPWQYGSSHEKFNIWSHIRGTVLFDIAYFFMFLWNSISSRFNIKSYYQLFYYTAKLQLFCGSSAVFYSKICFNRTIEIQLLLIQWNSVNTTTFGPWKFGRINGVGSNYGAKCF